MSFYSLVAATGPYGFGWASTAEEVTAGLDLSGRTILLTGCTGGLGKETARVLGLRGARVLGTARSRERAAAALAGVPGAVPLACDLADPDSVRACVCAIGESGATLDAIIANAGIMTMQARELAHGYELHFFTNHVGHFMVVTGLLDRLAFDGRVVVVSSVMHWFAGARGFDDLASARGYTAMGAYSRSKLANLLFARELGRRLNGSGRTASAVHPGVVVTDVVRNINPSVVELYRMLAPLVAKTAAQGAATQCFAAAHPAAAALSGAYLANSGPAASSATSRDPELARRLWALSEEIVARL